MQPLDTMTFLLQTPRGWSPFEGPVAGQDLYAFWKEVFEDANAASATVPQRAESLEPVQLEGPNHARTVSMAGASVDGASAPPDAANASPVLQTALPMRGDGEGIASAGRAGDQQRPAATGAGQASSATAPESSFNQARIAALHGADPSNRPPGGAVQTAEVLPAAEPLHGYRVDGSVSVEVGAGHGSPTAGGAELSGARHAESVRVYRRGDGLAIVVRDTSIGPALAVHCALETAMHLTGERRSLHHVTLNGKTVYEQLPDGVDAAPMACADTTLVFAC